MLFIKNLAKTKRSICLTECENEITNQKSLDFIISGSTSGGKGFEFLNLDPKVRELSDSIRESLEKMYVGEGLEHSIQDDLTEFSIYVRNKRLGVTEVKNADGRIHYQIGLVPETTDGTDKNYAKDIIVFVLDAPKDFTQTKLLIDKRNLIGSPVVLTFEKFQFITVLIRWPIWSSLKFPVAMSIEQDGKIVGSVKLSSKIINRKERNTIVDCDSSEVKLPKERKFQERTPKKFSDEENEESEKQYRSKPKFI